MRLFKEKNIKFVSGSKVSEVTSEHVSLEDGRVVPCDVAVWATGAEAHAVTADSDLDTMKGFFRVNDFLQSTSHPNVFGGGDCITMENYADKSYPTKAGVYAVKGAPFLGENILNFIDSKPLTQYIP